MENMESALDTMRIKLAEATSALEMFRQSYSTTKIKTIEPVNEDHERLDSEQAAKFAHISLNTLYKWVKTGRIRCYGTKRTRFFIKSELQEDLKNLR